MQESRAAAHGAVSRAFFTKIHWKNEKPVLFWFRRGSKSFTLAITFLFSCQLVELKNNLEVQRISMKYEINPSPLPLGTWKTARRPGLRSLRSPGFVSAKSSGFWCQVTWSRALLKGNKGKKKKLSLFIQEFKSRVLSLTLGNGFTTAPCPSCFECLPQNDVSSWSSQLGYIFLLKSPFGWWI